MEVKGKITAVIGAVVDAVFERIREEDEKAHEGQAEEQP